MTSTFMYYGCVFHPPPISPHYHHHPFHFFNQQVTAPTPHLLVICIHFAKGHYSRWNTVRSCSVIQILNTDECYPGN